MNSLIDIFGSCVSRDIFNVCKQFSNCLGCYIARTSIVGLFYKPVDLNQININLASSFQKRMVENDIYKTSFSKLRESNSSFLLVDFVDTVRFRLAKIENTYVTFSSEFANGTKGQRFILNSISDDNTFVCNDLSVYIDYFCNEIKKIYEESNLILHKVRWSNQYIPSIDSHNNVDNKVVCMGGRKNLINFSDELIKVNNIMNKRIAYLENCFLNNFPKAKILDLSELNLAADENHVWGLSPVHKEHRYYEEAMKILNEIICNNI